MAQQLDAATVEWIETAQQTIADLVNMVKKLSDENDRLKAKIRELEQPDDKRDKL